MFLKVFKYDFLDLIKKLWIPLAILPAVSLLCGVLNKVLYDTRFYVIAVLFSAVVSLLTSALCIGSIIICMQRYYRSMLSDEGYLTHTLPVNKSILLLGKLSAILVILMIVGVDYILSSIFSTLFDFDFFSLFEGLIDLTQFTNTTALIIGILIIIAIVLGSVLSVLHLATCLTLGARHDKNKVLKGFLYYIVINFVSSILLGILIAIGIVLADQISILTLEDLIYTILGVVILLESCVLVGEYFLTLFLLNKKLNLQ